MNYALANVRFKESGWEEEMVIKLSLDHTPKEDREIFFYCHGIEELKNLMREDNGEDFVVLDYTPITLFFS